MTNKTLITNPVTTVRYGNLKATVYWDRKTYLTVYVSDGLKITNTIYIPIDENFLFSVHGDKNSVIEEIDNRVGKYLQCIFDKNVLLERKRNILKNFAFFRVVNKIPFFLLKRNRKTNFL